MHSNEQGSEKNEYNAIIMNIYFSILSEYQKALKIYAGYNEQGKLKGIAAAGAAQGYADTVKLLYGYDPVCECIRGFSIIKMAETPGLGDKILTDEKYLSNFDALDATVDKNRNKLKNPIIGVKHGSKQNPWEVDAISGATITSNAVAKAININAQELLPRLLPHLSKIQSDSEIKATTKKEPEDRNN